MGGRGRGGVGLPKANSDWPDTAHLHRLHRQGWRQHAINVKSGKYSNVPATNNHPGTIYLHARYLPLPTVSTVIISPDLSCPPQHTQSSRWAPSPTWSMCIFEKDLRTSRAWQGCGIHLYLQWLGRCVRYHPWPMCGVPIPYPSLLWRRQRSPPQPQAFHLSQTPSPNREPR